MDDTSRTDEQNQIPSAMISDFVNDVDPMERFYRLAAQKDAEGIRKYGPVWKGKHPANEYIEEQLDSKCYLDRLFRDGHISYSEYKHATKTHFQLHWWMETVLRRLVG